MKEIPLSIRGKNAGKYVAIVDDDDYDYLMKWTWTVGNGRNTKYAIGREKKFRINMHRIIMKTPENLLCDHIDGNGLNNQKSNLRNCSRSQNQWNRRKTINTSSKYTGVHLFRCRKKTYWMSQIRANKIVHHIGYFKTEEDAALAYNKRATELHGEFARLNKIEEAA